MRCGSLACRRQRGDRLCAFDLRYGLGQRLLQSHGQHLVHGIDEVQLHRSAQVFCHFSKIFLVVLGQNYFEKTCTMRRQQFFFQSANRQYFPAKRNRRSWRGRGAQESCSERSKLPWQS